MLSQVAEEFDFKNLVYCHAMSSVATRHNLVAVASKAHEISIVDLKSGAKSHLLKGHKRGVLDVKWSPRNEYLLASGR